jgi:uncharacterized protein YegP (UPF0339 family)
MADTNPKFRIKKDNSGGYYWIFYAANNEEIARSSESYARKSSCIHGIALIRKHGPGARVYDWTNPDNDGNYPQIPADEIV